MSHPLYKEIASYDPDKKCINIFPENLLKGNVINELSDKNAPETLYYYVIHEAEHAIDPFLRRKITEKDKNKNDENDNKFFVEKSHGN